MITAFINVKVTHSPSKQVGDMFGTLIKEHDNNLKLPTRNLLFTISRL